MEIYDNFYLFSSGQRPSALHVDSTDHTDSMIKDPYAISFGTECHQEPLEFIAMMGRKPMDLITTSWAVLHILSDRVVQAFTHAGITGWTTYPVRIWDKHRSEVPGYHGFAVTGRSGPIDDSRSVRTRRVPATDPTVNAGAPYWAWVGLYFDESRWDGSDIFITKSPAEESGYLIVTQRVHDLLISIKATNIHLVALPIVERLVLDTGEYAAPRDPTWEF